MKCTITGTDLTETDQKTPIITLDVSDDKITPTCFVVVNGIMFFVTLVVFILLVGCYRDVGIWIFSLRVPRVLELVQFDSGMVTLTYLGTLLGLVILLMFFCVLWYKVIRWNHKVLRGYCDFSLQLLNTLKDMSSTPRWPTGNGLRYKICVNTAANKANKKKDAPDGAEKNKMTPTKTPKVTVEKPEETVEKPERKDEGEEKKGELTNSETGNPQQGTSTVMNGVGGINPIFGREVITSTCTVDLSSSVQPPYTNSTEVASFEIQHSLSVPGEPGNPLQKGR